MSYGEFLSWVKYANKTGPLRTAKHLSMSGAYIAMMFAAAYLKKKDGSGFSVSDFLLWEKEEDQEADPEQVFKMFKAIAAGNTDGK